jgi:3-methyladenine DNA glycosylase AlkD
VHAYAKKIKALLPKHADPLAAPAMQRYMRDQFEYLGIKSPALSAALKGFYTENGLPSIGALDEIVRDLWQLPQREYQYTANGLVSRMAKELPEDFIATLEFLLTTKSWWDTVDTLAGHAVGDHFKRYPRAKQEYLAKWRKSQDFWLRRTTLLFQLDYKGETDFELLKELICENLGSKEFFINKAIGWSLRQYSRIDEQGVREFVGSTPLSNLSAREALAWLERRDR